MDTDKLNDTAVVMERIANSKEFNHLEPHRFLKNYSVAELRLGGYNDLTLTIMDILKVCIIALDAQEHISSDLVRDPAMSISSVLGIALQLIPTEESQILDECYKLHLKLKEKQDGDKINLPDN